MVPCFFSFIRAKAREHISETAPTKFYCIRCKICTISSFFESKKDVRKKKKASCVKKCVKKCLSQRGSIELLVVNANVFYSKSNTVTNIGFNLVALLR